MKILHLLASPFFTGPADTVLQLALAQRALGHDVSVAVDRKRTQTTSEELLVPRLEAHGLLSKLPLELSVKSTPMAMARDVLALRRADADVVHAHFSHDHTLLRLGRPRGSVTVRSIHAPRSLRRFVPAADGFTVPYEALTRGLLGQRVLILPALIPDSLSPGERAGVRGARRIGMVSTFQPSRRHQLALNAFKKLPDAELILIGDGPLEAELKAHADARVHFTGYLSGDAFFERLKTLDEVWILGLGNDWSARAAAQARACGVRVVAVDEGALSLYADELIEPTEEALLSLTGARRELQLESATAITQRVLQFYDSLREKR